jgi:hypothetical protein
MVATGNPLDIALEKLRQDVRERLAGDRSEELERRYGAHKAHLRRMIGILREDLAQARVLADPDAPEIKEMIANADALKRASGPEFWEELDREPLDGLEFLENRVAPLAMEAGFTFVRYVGTDLEAFFHAFDRTQVVEGERVPAGHRGILLGKWYAEEWLKLKPARLLDKIRTAREAHGRRIAEDEELSRWVREASGQLREISLQLDPIQAEEAASRLRRALGSEERDLPKLLAALFQVNDANFDRHYRIFYDELAPLLRLYLIRIGDTITIKAPARSGYMNSVNVKVYGFVQFRGLEQSGIAGVMSLMDLMTFRDLYGYVTREKAEEIARIQERSGARAVSREDAEAELFGSATGLVGETAAAPIDDSALLGRRDAGAARDLAARSYTQEEIDGGVALNAALILEDPRRLGETARDVEAAARAAGLHLKVVDWQEASGLVGRFVTLARLILWVAVLIIFLVALVIINNAMVMATLQRVKEIGTMRAIGAQRRFILAMLLTETVAVGIAFGIVGAIVGVGGLWVIRALGGIPATNDQLFFFFSGPSLLPTLGGTSVAIALAIVVVVSIASGLYPALLAMRVTPLEAMQAEE